MVRSNKASGELMGLAEFKLVYTTPRQSLVSMESPSPAVMTDLIEIPVSHANDQTELHDAKSGAA